MDLAETEHVCSAASKKSKYREEVRVGPQTTRFVPFVIIPTKEGTHRIGVKASVKDSELNDGIVKELHVVVRDTDSVVGLKGFFSVCHSCIMMYESHCSHQISAVM